MMFVTLICPECGHDMHLANPDHWQCENCKLMIEQLNIEGVVVDEQ